MAEITKTCKIQNTLGLHARAAAQFVKISSQFQSEVTIQKGNREANGKSIMGILTLGAAKGSNVTLHAIGADAEEAIQELSQLIENKFGEN